MATVAKDMLASILSYFIQCHMALRHAEFRINMGDEHMAIFPQTHLQSSVQSPWLTSSSEHIPPSFSFISRSDYL